MQAGHLDNEWDGSREEPLHRGDEIALNSDVEGSECLDISHGDPVSRSGGQYISDEERSETDHNDTLADTDDDLGARVEGWLRNANPPTVRIRINTEDFSQEGEQRHPSPPWLRCACGKRGCLHRTDDEMLVQAKLASHRRRQYNYNAFHHLNTDL